MSFDLGSGAVGWWKSGITRATVGGEVRNVDSLPFSDVIGSSFWL